MWGVVRVLAVAVLVAAVVLLAGWGGWLVGVVDATGGLVGAGFDAPRAALAVPEAAAGAGLVAGAIAALARPVDRVVGQVVTLVHELGHTVTAAALGARPSGIVLRHDASGHATARWVGGAGRLRRLALAAVAFAGLPAAAVASAAGARLLLLAGPTAVLGAVAGAGAVVAVLARSWWSLLLAVAVAALAVVAVADLAQPTAIAVVIAGLVATATKTAVDGVRALLRPLAPGDDARAVAGCVWLPARLVQLAQVAVSAALAVWTAWLVVAAVPGLG